MGVVLLNVFKISNKWRKKNSNQILSAAMILLTLTALEYCTTHDSSLPYECIFLHNTLGLN